MQRIAVKFAYDGTKFYGYQRQPSVRTVESEIIQALTSTKMIEDVKNAKFQSASRTDRYVSGLGNVCAFNTNFRSEEILRALNATVKDIWFYGIAKVDLNFNPRHAKQRWYRYLIVDLGENYSLRKLRKCGKLFVGEHNFINFAKRGEEKNYVRHIDSIKITRLDDFIAIDIRAENFLWNQVRRIVNALLEYEQDLLDENTIQSALRGEIKKYNFGAARAEPLFLMDVVYDFNFDIDRGATKMIEYEINKVLGGAMVREEFFKLLRTRVLRF